MKLLFRKEGLNSTHGVVAAIGNFDGVHLGHQALLKQLKLLAGQQDRPAMVVLFEPQPREFFLGKQADARLTSLREKATFIEQLQIDYLQCLRFNDALATMSPDDFAEKILFSQLQIKWLLVGQDFRFGKHRAGDVPLLVDLGKKYDCTVVTFPDFVFQNSRVSSTLIRQQLVEGHLDNAKRLLGRSFCIHGRVARGQGLGRQWGIPTANICLSSRKSPLSGIFCVQVRRSNGVLLLGVASLGTRPTVGGGDEVLEVHLFDFDDNLYGERLQVSFLHRLRDEIKFDSVAALIEQIHQDIAMAKRILKSEEYRLPCGDDSESYNDRL